MRYLRFTAATVIAAFSFSLVPSTAYAQSADDLKAKHVAYTGWTFGDGKIQSLDLTETVTLDKDGKLIRTERTRSIGALYRRDTDDVESAETSTNGFTGNLFWFSDASGFTVPVIGKVKKYQLAQALIFSDALPALPWTIGSTQTVEGTSCTVAHVSQENAFPIDVCVDSSGAYKSVTIDPGGDFENRFFVRDYAEVLPGKRVISKYHYEDSTATHAFTKMSANGVTAVDLHPPDQSAQWDFSNPRPFPIKVTQVRIIVDAMVNGVPGRFILDTGAGSIFFTQAFAEKAHLKPEGKFEAGGIAGQLEVHSAKVDTITVGGNTLHNAVVAYGGNTLDSDAPDGLLGFTVLAGANVSVDIGNQTMQIRPPSTFDYSAIQGVRLGIDLSSGQPGVPMKLNGVDVDAIFDSGDPQLVLFSPELSSHYGLKMLVDDSIAALFSTYRVIGGVSGSYEIAECGHLDEIALGAIHYQNVNACKSPSFGGRGALISLDFLRNFAVLDFDYPRATMVLIPPKH